MNKKPVPAVMLIDDNRIDNILNRKVLEKEAFAENILVFDKAQEALDYLKEINAQIPDFIFIDVVMPHMNGFEFIREFNNLPPDLKSRTNIIFISSSFLTAAQQAELNRYDVQVSVVEKPLSKMTLDKLR